MNQFSVFIKEKLKLENLTNIDFLAKLNLYHQDFSELDAVTLSRWINGRSTPSLRRQLLICEFFKYDRLKFIDTAVSFKLSNSIKDHIRNHYEKMENSGFNQSSGVVAKRYFCIDNMSFSEYVNRFRGQFPEVLIDIYEHDATFSDNMITVVHNMSKDNLYHYSFASYMNLDSSIAMVINKKPEFFAKNVIFLPLAKVQFYQTYKDIYRVLFRDAFRECNLFDSTVVKCTRSLEHYKFVRDCGFELFHVDSSKPIKVYYLKLDALDFFSSSRFMDLMVSK